MGILLIATGLSSALTIATLRLLAPHMSRERKIYVDSNRERLERRFASYRNAKRESKPLVSLPLRMAA